MTTNIQKFLIFLTIIQLINKTISSPLLTSPTSSTTNKISAKLFHPSSTKIQTKLFSSSLNCPIRIKMLNKKHYGILEKKNNKKFSVKASEKSNSRVEEYDSVRLETYYRGRSSHLKRYPLSKKPHYEIKFLSLEGITYNEVGLYSSGYGVQRVA
uniref:Uncharacterized protein n=1 Tax=Meloidogyne enterolobii TaxID=390850 RepID=A0A6V7UL92_MELEN|nr:unnamed protein product [Meloidogyne enterolobii]